MVISKARIKLICSREQIRWGDYRYVVDSLVAQNRLQLGQ
jgi:hypothetical protein